MCRIITLRRLLYRLLCPLVATLLSVAGSVTTAGSVGQGEELLRSIYQSNVAKLQNNSYGLPLLVESSEQDDRAQVHVYGVFDYPFGSVVSMLTVPANWCAIVALSPNVKACTHRSAPGDQLLTMYLGRKVYQPPHKARQVVSHFRTVVQQPEYLDVMLTAEKGPFGTRDHQLRFEAMPLDGRRTFAHVSYAYSESAALRLAEQAYFATIGRSKIGFTVTGTDTAGNPVHIGGRRGALERNAGRYYFAIQAFMNTVRHGEARRFAMRISTWYDLASRFKKQLLDLEKDEYLRIKTLEQKNQLALQQRIHGTRP
jgi:hypothetical protein